MKAKYAVLVVMLLLAGVAVTQLRRQAVAQVGEAQAAAVRKVLDDQAAAWNRGDLEGFMAGYAKGDELKFYSDDQVTSGWQSTFDRYKKRYQSDGAEMGKLVFRDLEIEVLSADAAFARGRWHLTRSKDAPHGLFTLLLKRTKDGWRVVHDHTSAAKPPEKKPE